MTTTTIQVRGRGTLTLPASLREKYRLGEGDPLTMVDLDERCSSVLGCSSCRGSLPKWNAFVERES